MKKIFTFIVAAVVAMSLSAAELTLDLNTAQGYAESGSVDLSLSSNVLNVSWTVNTSWSIAGATFALDNLTNVSKISFDYKGDGNDVEVLVYLENANGNKMWDETTGSLSMTQTEWTSVSLTPDGALWTETSEGPWIKLAFVANPATPAAGVLYISNIKIEYKEPVQQDISLDPSIWSWGYNSRVAKDAGGNLQTTITSEWGAVSTGWEPEVDLSSWDRIVVVVDQMTGCAGEWFKLKAYLRDQSDSESNQLEGTLGLDADDSIQHNLVIDLKQENANFDITKCRVLAIQCQPETATFTISRVYLEKDEDSTDPTGGNSENPTAYFINAAGWQDIGVAVWVWKDDNWANITQHDGITKTSYQVNGYEIYAYTFPKGYSGYAIAFVDGQSSDHSHTTSSHVWSAEKPYFCVNGKYDDVGYAQGDWYASVEDYVTASSGTGPVEEQEVTTVEFTTEDFATQTSEAPAKISFEKDGVYLTCTEANGNSRALICSQGSQIQISSDATIRYIDFTFLSENYSGGLEERYVVEGDNWTGSLSGQAYITQIKVTLAQATVNPETCPYYGICGDSVSWTLDCNGLLAVYGSGAMYDYDMPSFSSPWLDYLSAIKEAFVGEGVTTIGDWAFYADTNMVSVTFGGDIQVIGAHAFTECTGLTFLNLPERVTTIKYAAFSDCYNLSAIIIPNSVTSIEDGAFAECRGLQELVCYATTPPALGQDVFWHTDQTQATLYVPRNSIKAYRAADQWREFANILGMEVEGEETVVTIFGLDIEIPDTIGEGGINLLGDSTLMYDPEENTLTFNSLTMEVGEDEGTAISYSGEEPLTIVLNDESSIIADTVIASTGDIIITGTGSLVAEGTVPIIGEESANITFDSVNMYVHSLPSAAAVRRRIRGVKTAKDVDENGGPALSGFGNADFNKVNVSPSGASYGAVSTNGESGTEILHALYVQNGDGSQTVVTEFTLTAIPDDNEDAVETIRNTHQPFDPTLPMYNILGVQVDAAYKGLVIQGGQTYLLR